MTNQLRSPLRSSLRSPFEHRRGGWSPLALFSAGEQGFIYDLSDMSTLFHDSAGTTPVTAANQPVGLMLDKSGRGNHAVQPTAGKRPMLKTDGVNWYLQGDGIDDFMYTGNIDFTGTDKMTVWAGINKTSGIGAIFSHGRYGSDQGSVELTKNEGGTNYAVLMTGSPAGYSKIKFTPASDGENQVVTASIDRAAAAAVESRCSVDGVSLTGAQEQPGVTGNFGDQPLYVSARKGSSQYSTAPIYSLIIRGAASSADELSKANIYTAKKTGVTL